MDEFIDIKDYTYELPPQRIALYPLPARDQSKLLVHQNGQLSHHTFQTIASLLPKNSVLFFNNTQVIPARLIFKKDTGAEIEIFLLNPVRPSSIVQEAMIASSPVQWHCAIGNLKRWPDSTPLQLSIDSTVIEARLVDRQKGLVEFSWPSVKVPFAEIIRSIGKTPLPPYIKRSAEPSDRERYQTVYASAAGAVAAPTAGLHFTDAIAKQIREKGMLTDYLTLHVSAGTFQPVKVENAVEHEMHEEQIVLNKKNIDHLLMTDRPIVAVGTTSLRTLESLYWYGVKLLTNPNAGFIIEKMDPYTDHRKLPLRKEAMQAIKNHMQKNNLEEITGETSIYILPGYNFMMVDALITNFHQPGSTLLLLIAAFVGEEWKRIYQEALSNEYRFLSYGDSSLLIRS